MSRGWRSDTYKPRFRVLVDDPEEQAVLAKSRVWTAERVGLTERADRLNADGIRPPQGEQWTKGILYNTESANRRPSSPRRSQAAFRSATRKMCLIVGSGSQKKSY